MTQDNIFGAWLREAREMRGQTMQALADRAEITQPMVSSLERGIRNPSRDMVERLAVALSPEDADEYTAQSLLNAGLRAAFPRPEDNPGYDEHEVIDYLRGKPASQQDKALKLLRTAFDEEDAIDNEGNIGKGSD